MKPYTRVAVALALFAAPVAADEAAEKEFTLGVKTYKDFCAHCHGPNMVNPGTNSYDLRKWPQDRKEDFVTAVVSGKGDMPAWGDILRPDEVEALWRYVVTRGGKEPFPEPASDNDGS
jgi:mono/diheme cytochrome c family protein